MVSVKLYPYICHLYIYISIENLTKQASDLNELKEILIIGKITLYYSDLLLISPLEMIKNYNIESSRSDTVPISENNLLVHFFSFLVFIAASTHVSFFYFLATGFA